MIKYPRMRFTAAMPPKTPKTKKCVHQCRIDLDDFMWNVAVRMRVHAIHRLFVRRVDQTESSVPIFIEPIGQEPHTVFVLDRQIFLVGQGDRASRGIGHVVAIHIDGHSTSIIGSTAIRRNTIRQERGITGRARRICLN